MNEFSQTDELAPWQAPFRKSLHSFGSVQHQEQTAALVLPMSKDRFLNCGVMTWPFHALIYPKTIMAVKPMVGCHHIHCLASPEFPFFFHLVAHISFSLLFPKPSSWDLWWTLDCSPSALLSLAAGLEFHLVPFKILKFFPNLQVGTEVVLHCTKLFIANLIKLQLIFPMRRKSNYPVFFKEVQIINL